MADVSIIDLEAMLDVHDLSNDELEAMLDVHNEDFVRPIMDIKPLKAMVAEFESMDKVIMGWLNALRLCDETKLMIEKLQIMQLVVGVIHNRVGYMADKNPACNESLVESNEYYQQAVAEYSMFKLNNGVVVEEIILRFPDNEPGVDPPIELDEAAHKKARTADDALQDFLEDAIEMNSLIEAPDAIIDVDSDTAAVVPYVEGTESETAVDDLLDSLVDYDSQAHFSAF